MVKQAIERERKIFLLVQKGLDNLKRTGAIAFQRYAESIGKTIRPVIGIIALNRTNLIEPTARMAHVARRDTAPHGNPGQVGIFQKIVRLPGKKVAIKRARTLLVRCPHRSLEASRAFDGALEVERIDPHCQVLAVQGHIVLFVIPVGSLHGEFLEPCGFPL